MTVKTYCATMPFQWSLNCALEIGTAFGYTTHATVVASSIKHESTVTWKMGKEKPSPSGFGVRMYLLKKFRKRLSRKYAVTVAPISTLRLTTRSCGGSPLAIRPLASVGLWLAMAPL